jgi:hypothetical protein
MGGAVSEAARPRYFGSKTLLDNEKGLRLPANQLSFRVPILAKRSGMKSPLSI